jgi:signal transduction histidine kinase
MLTAAVQSRVPLWVGHELSAAMAVAHFGFTVEALRQERGEVVRWRRWAYAAVGSVAVYSLIMRGLGNPGLAYAWTLIVVTVIQAVRGGYCTWGWLRLGLRGFAPIALCDVLLLPTVVWQVVNALQVGAGARSFALGADLVVHFGFALVAMVFVNLGYLTLVLEREYARHLASEREAAAAEARERVVQATLAERNELVQRLARSDRAALVGLFAAALPHELSQPLTAQQLKLASVAMRLEQQGASPELLATLRGGITDGERAGQMLDRIRSLIAGQPGARVERLDLVALVRDVLAIVEARCAREGVRIQADWGPALCWVWGDPTALQQVLLILMANALDALAAHGGDKVIALSLERDASSPEPRVRLCMRDTGPGLAPAQLEDLFQPFRTTKPEGLGVGLAFAAHLAELQGGSIAPRAPEPGSRFTGAGFVLDLPGDRQACPV